MESTVKYTKKESREVEVDEIFTLKFAKKRSELYQRIEEERINYRQKKYQELVNNIYKTSVQ